MEETALHALRGCAPPADGPSSWRSVMFEKILTDPAALLRHRSAPFSDERERYLQSLGRRKTLPSLMAFLKGL
jgi:hypothetical protein